MMTKTIFKTVLLSVALTGTMVSCQKESEMISSQELSQKSLAQETSILYYKIDREKYYQKFLSREERNEFIFYLLHLTRNGHIITIKGNDNFEYAPGELNKQKFETTDEREMLVWIIDMIARGYNVEYGYNDASGTYVGTATREGNERGTTAISTERDTDSM